jgi:hypothetical protein
LPQHQEDWCSSATCRLPLATPPTSGSCQPATPVCTC